MYKYLLFTIIFYGCNKVNNVDDVGSVYIYSYKNLVFDTTTVARKDGRESSYKCQSGSIFFNYKIVDVNNIKLFCCLVKSSEDDVVEIDSMSFESDKILIKRYFFERNNLYKIMSSYLHFDSTNVMSWFDKNSKTLSYNSFSVFLSLIDYGETKENRCTPFWNLDMLNLNSAFVLGLNKESEADSVWSIDENNNRFLEINQNHFFVINSYKQLVEHIIIGNSKKSFLLSDTVYINRLIGEDAMFRRYYCEDYIEGTYKEIFKAKTLAIKDSIRIIDFGRKDTTMVTIARKNGSNFYKEDYSNGIIITRFSF